VYHGLRDLAFTGLLGVFEYMSLTVAVVITLIFVGS
jgi:hypothetical protein